MDILEKNGHHGETQAFKTELKETAVREERMREDPVRTSKDSKMAQVIHLLDITTSKKNFFLFCFNPVETGYIYVYSSLTGKNYKQHFWLKCNSCGYNTYVMFLNLNNKSNFV